MGEHKPEVFRVPDIGAREKAMNLALTKAMYLLQACGEVIQPWYGPSATATAENIRELLPEVKAAMALPFDRYRIGSESDLSFDHEKAEQERTLAALSKEANPHG